MIHATGTFKGWIPGDMLDETVPRCRAHPDDFLVRGDVLRLTSAAEAHGDPPSWFDPSDAHCTGIPVKDGDVVAFAGLTNFGEIRLKIGADGQTFEAIDPVPPEATLFRLPADNDTIADDLKTFVENLHQDDIPEDRTVGVECYDWSERQFVLKGGHFVLAPIETPAGSA